VGGCYSLFLGTTSVIDKSWCLMTRMIASLFECIKGNHPPPPLQWCAPLNLHLSSLIQDLRPLCMELMLVKDCKFMHRHLSLMRQENSMLLMCEQQLLSHVKWSYCWTICRSLHREPSDNLLGEFQNVISLLTVGLLFCSEGQVQEEMKKLKIINRSGVAIQLTELIAGIHIGEIITIALDCEHNYPCNHYLEDKAICLDLPPQHSVDRPCIHLNGDFMDANKIAYVRKGDGDRWFCRPYTHRAKLVRKCVCNSTPSQIALVEFVLE